jgi:thiol-disulfide isomerase/thioredoxin
MMKRLLVLSFTLFLCFTSAMAQHVKQGGVKALKAFYQRDNDTTYVINFWATWCGPCVEEISAFDQLKAANSNNKVKILLVSLDFKKDYKTKLLPFVHKKGLHVPVMRMSDTDANIWIPQVNNDWTGSIPATLIVNNAKKINRLIERQISYEELEAIVKETLK